MEEDRDSWWGSGRHGRLALVIPLLFFGACENGEDGSEESREGASQNTTTLDSNSTGEALYSGAMEGGIQNEEYAAALRATKYLIDAAPTMDPIWSALTFQRLYKIAPTEGSARRVKSIFDDVIARPMGPVPDRLDSPQLLETAALRPIVIELWRRRMTGEAWQEPAAAIEAFLAEHEAEFWPPIKPTQQLVFLYLFDTIDIETQRTKEDVARELHERWSVGNRAQLVFDIHFLYGVTHVIYVDSGYGDRLLDPADYGVEIEIVETAIARYAAAFPPDPTAIDLTFELLAARRFLQLPESGEARKLKSRLLLLQDESGSWRPGSGNNTLHATREAIYALGQFPTEFRRLDPAPPSSH